MLSRRQPHPFIAACENRDVHEATRWIRESKDEASDVSVRALSTACKRGQLKIATLLVSELFQYTTSQWCVAALRIGFFKACRHGNLKVVEFIHSHLPGDPSILDDALRQTCENYNFFNATSSVIAYLLRMGARDFNGALESSCLNGNLVLICDWIKRDASHFERGLITACKGGKDSRGEGDG